jgi:hypothetical protein
VTPTPLVASPETVPPPEPPPPAAPELDRLPTSAATPPGASFPSFVGSAGLSARVLSGVAPAALLGGEVWLRGGWESGTAWSPEVGVSFAYSEANDVIRPDGNSKFKLEQFGVELCPLRLGNRGFEVRPCAIGEYGRFSSEGYQTFRAHRETRPWASLGASVEGVVHLGRVQLRALLGLGHPLVRDSVRFGLPECATATCDDGVFHRVAAIVGLFGLGAGVSFP